MLSSFFPGLAFVDKVALVWFILDAITHLTLELSYCVLTWFGGAEKFPENAMAWTWLEYAKADRRWAVYDTNVLSLELLTALVVGPLCALMIYGIAKQKAWRHPLQLVICVMELYGGWMTFAPDWLSGSPNLNGHLYYVWVYLFFFNCLWVWTPAVLAYDSFAKAVRAFAYAKIDTGNCSGSAASKERNASPAGQGWYTFVAATLVMYALLIPGVLLAAKMGWSPAPHPWADQPQHA